MMKMVNETINVNEYYDPIMYKIDNDEQFPLCNQKEHPEFELYEPMSYNAAERWEMP